MENSNSDPKIEINDKTVTNVKVGDFLKVTVEYNKNTTPYKIVSQKIQFERNGDPNGNEIELFLPRK